MKYGEMELAVNISGKDTFHKSTCCNTNAYKDLHECMYDLDMYVSVDGWHLWCISLAVVCVFFLRIFPTSLRERNSTQVARLYSYFRDVMHLFIRRM